MVVMQIDFQKFLNYLLVLLAVSGGLVLGALGGRFIDFSLGGSSVPVLLPPARQAGVRPLEEKDFQIVLERNLFNSAAVGEFAGQIDLSTPIQTASAQAATAISELRLIGTIVAGDESLALIQTGKKVGIFKLNETPAPGVTITEIQRKMVVLDERGQRHELPLIQQQDAKPQLVSRRGGANAVQQDGIVALAEDRWQISRAVADNARANLNSLLQTARVVPELKDGQTVGFKLVEMEKGSLLEKIGLKVGDLIVEINQVELNSPEKALQIFQQVREANNISLGLIRNGQPETFEYRFE